MGTEELWLIRRVTGRRGSVSLYRYRQGLVEVVKVADEDIEVIEVLRHEQGMLGSLLAYLDDVQNGISQLATNAWTSKRGRSPRCRIAASQNPHAVGPLSTERCKRDAQQVRDNGLEEITTRGSVVTALVPSNHGQVVSRLFDADRLIERWSEGRSKQTLRAYSNDLRHFSDWLGGFLGTLTLSTAQAVTTLLTKPQGEANEIVRAYRSAMVERGLSPSTINRKLSALRSLVALGKELGFVTFDLATRNVRAEAYRDTRGPEPDAMAALIQEALAHPHKAKAARDVAIFLLLGYGRALRRGEVVELDLEHFDARGSRVSVLRKGKRERKWLSLDPLVTGKLRAWVALRGKEPGPLFLQLGKGGRVLAGRRLSGDGVHKILETLGAKLGGIIRPHGLRHAAITAALDETNGNVRAAREFSGHASIEVLMRYDDNRKDVGGEVASKVIRSLAKLLGDAKARPAGGQDE